MNTNSSVLYNIIIWEAGEKVFVSSNFSLKGVLKYLAHNVKSVVLILKEIFFFVNSNQSSSYPHFLFVYAHSKKLRSNQTDKRTDCGKCNQTAVSRILK